ncbi:unnamed protein product [Arctia plantaginis]|uniref:Uncharacterized protein n=1 Tax=Arctia plantaginis TaxID=874455 RepID=A0A8S1ASU0_ARCPL|nr:unnamed protein product [Arctia plantaginis]
MQSKDVIILSKSTNPFDSDCEIPASQLAPSVEKKKQRKKVVDKTKKRTKTNALDVKSSFIGSETESDVDLSAPSTSSKKRKQTDSENELELGGEPLRAAALRSFLSRRSGSGYTL